MHSQQDLTQRILSLSPEQRLVVNEFIDTMLKLPNSRPTFREALDRFKREHPELLRLLAQ
jgi:hypothetical protein